MRSYGETRCIDQQKTKTKIKMKDVKKYRAIYCTNCRTGSPRHDSNRRRPTREGPEPACVQTLCSRHRRERRANFRPAVVPSSRRGKNLQLDARRKNRAARKGKVVATWYGDDSPHLSLPNSQPSSAAVRECAQVTGKAGENGQN